VLHGRPVEVGGREDAVRRRIGRGCRDELRVGQRVAVWPLHACGRCYPCRLGRANACEHFRLSGIHIDGGLQERLAIGEDQVFPIAVDDPAIAAMAEPVSIAVRAVHRAHIAPEGKVVVLGAGPIGLSVCLVARAHGATVLVVAHDKRVVPYADRVFEMEDGRMVNSYEAEEPGPRGPVPGCRAGRRRCLDARSSRGRRVPNRAFYIRPVAPHSSRS